MERISTIGRCEAAVARVYLIEGSGKIATNKKGIISYFPSSVLQFIVKQLLVKPKVADKYDIRISFADGGFKGQSEVVRLGITRTFIKINPEGKATLRVAGLVTHDPRATERRKPGRLRAYKRL